MEKQKTYTLLDIPVQTFSKREFLPWWVDASGFQHVVTINAEMFVDAQKNKEFLEILRNKSVNVPDSISVIWASYFLSRTCKSKFSTILHGIWSLVTIPFYQKKLHSIIPERLSGSDIFWDIIGMSAISKQTVFLLGGAEGVAMNVASIVQDKVTNARIVGAISGGDAEAQAKDIVKAVNKAKPDVLIVAFGAPKQELWIQHHIHEMPSVKRAIGVGGTFDYITGTKRAPMWMRDIGLEWLYRLIKQPLRFKRIKKAVFDFPYLVIKYKLTEK